MAKYKVCLNAEFDPEVFEADSHWLGEETGWLKLLRKDSEDKLKPFAQFAPGKWVYFTKEES